MVNVDRMVSRLMELMENTHLPAGLGSSREDGIAEMILGNHLRTAEGK